MFSAFTNRIQFNGVVVVRRHSRGNGEPSPRHLRRRRRRILAKVYYHIPSSLFFPPFFKVNIYLFISCISYLSVALNLQVIVVVLVEEEEYTRVSFFSFFGFFGFFFEWLIRVLLENKVTVIQISRF